MNAYAAMMLGRESRFQLFQQLHQSPDDEALMRAHMWRRASGEMLCSCCGLPYRVHPLFKEGGIEIDHRLCDGDVVHL
jgi:hypothetical protein